MLASLGPRVRALAVASAARWVLVIVPGGGATVKPAPQPRRHLLPDVDLLLCILLPKRWCRSEWGAAKLRSAPVLGREGKREQRQRGEGQDGFVISYRYVVFGLKM